MPENSYEKFRTILIMNLCNVIGPDQLTNVLNAVDLSMGDFEITRKKMELITACDGIPEVVKIYLASKAISNLSAKTLAQYRYKLVNFFDTVRKSFMDISANDIRMYLYRYKVDHNATDRYIENIRITLNSFFDWLVLNEYLPRNPCAKIEHIKYQEKKRAPLSSLDLEYLRWNTSCPREKALVDFFFATGCRLSECADVRLSDINWSDRSVRIRHGKGDKERIVFFNAESEVSLRAPHQALKCKAIENIVSKIAARAGLHVYPHLLRHTFATSSLRGGMPLPVLQSLMGHSDPKTTLIYAKQDRTDLQREHQRVYS